MAMWRNLFNPVHFPDDAEAQDEEILAQHIDKIMDEMYPSFEPDILYSAWGKEYFLPALKVLERDSDGDYHSPQQKSHYWYNMELSAVCIKQVITNNGGWAEKVSPTGHLAPEEGCTCGIYGSVNLEEIQEWLKDETFNQAFITGIYLNGNPFSTSKSISIDKPAPKKVLCIIEPSPDAKVIMCRKGWKASKAFISEIIGETMDVREASELLSIAWHRVIDITKLQNKERYGYEGR